MNGDDYVAKEPEAERAHEKDDGQDFERGSLEWLTTEDLHSESPTDNYSPGPNGSPDHTLVYNAMYQSCRDLTACGSWDGIRSSTPNRKSKPMHSMNQSTTSINQSVTEYVPFCFSHELVELIPSSPECGASLGTPPTATSSPDIPIFPTLESSSEIYAPDVLLAIPDRHVLTGSPFPYVPLGTLGRGVHENVFAARLRDIKDDNIYILKTIPKADLEQRRVTEVTKELWILRFIADASLSNKPFPFIQKLKDIFQDEKILFIVLEHFTTTLAHPETASPFRLPRKVIPPGLSLSPSKTYQSEQEAIQALRFLAADLTLGLLFLHRHGVVHQDIKPANVMISEGGHAVIGGFGAASVLPVLSQPGSDPVKRSYPSSCVYEDGAKYGSIILQPEDTATFTHLYAAPELLARKENGLLVYDERVDWWSLGVSLYEITTGSLPFHISSNTASIGRGLGGGENGLVLDLLEALDLKDSAARGCDAHLGGYLRSLLVHDPNYRLSGESVKSHPFLEPLQNIWVEIEDLRHPPCGKPSARVMNEGDIDPSVDLQEDLSKFDAHCTQASCSRDVLESPQSSLDEEFHTPREVFSSPEQDSLESPPFLTRKMEALVVKRPRAQVPWNDNSAINSNELQEGGSTVILQQEAFMSYYIESSFRINGSFPVGRPLPLTTRHFSNGQPHGMCSTPKGGTGIPEENSDEGIVRLETSFTDSGLDFPLGSSPESWGHRKSDYFGKPMVLRPIQGQEFQGLSKDSGGRIHDEILAKLADFPQPDWTFDEKITISLLQASLRGREISEPTVRSRLSKPQLVAAASERIVKAAGRRVADMLRRR